MPTAVKVGASADVPEGGVRSFEVAGRKVAVLRLGGALFAMDGTCPHRGGPLGEGTVADGVLTCPWHGWRFDGKSGGCLNMPGKTQACFTARDEGGALVVEV